MNGGQSAFPNNLQVGPNGDVVAWSDAGMTYRQWLFGQALSGPLMEMLIKGLCPNTTDFHDLHPTKQLSVAEEAGRALHKVIDGILAAEQEAKA